MKTPMVLLGAALLFASSAQANGIETIFSALSEPQEPPPARVKPARPRGEASMKAMCKEVDVAVDEGYGVSSHEKRVVCAPPEL